MKWITYLFSGLFLVSGAGHFGNDEIRILRGQETEIRNPNSTGERFVAPENEQEIFISLTFQNNNAEQAMNLYLELFEDSRILRVQRWGAEGPGKEGSIMQAVFTLNGQKFMVSDSPPVHDWDFTPAVSPYVQCRSVEELDRLFNGLSEEGQVAMYLGDYGFSSQFGWVIDRFGVSWQLNLE